MFARIISIG